MEKDRKRQLIEAKSLLSQGDLDAAQQAFRQVIAAAGEDFRLYSKWAEYLDDADEKQSSRQILIQAHAMSEGDRRIQLALCDQLYRQGWQADSLRLLPLPAKQEPAIECMVRIKILRVGGNSAEIVRLIRRLLATATLEVERWAQLSALAQENRDPSLALALHKKAMAAGPATGPALARLAELHLENKDLARAQAAIADVPAIFENDESVLFTRARCAVKAGSEESAAMLFERVLERNPQNGKAWFGLAAIAPSGDLAELTSRCRYVLEGKNLKPEIASFVAFALGRLYERQDSHMQCFECIDAANKMLKQIWRAQGRPYKPRTVEGRRRIVVSRFNKQVMAPFALAANDTPDPTPLFIVGMPRSGTTLLEKMLSLLNNVQAGGENGALGKVVQRHPLSGDAAGGSDLADATVLQELAAKYWTLTAHEGGIVTNKLPQNYFWLGWALAMFPAAPVIYLKRDPRDIGWSMFKQPFRPSFAYSVDQKHLAHAISECDRYMDHWCHVAPGRILTVHYENLVADPKTVSKEIASFCGLEWRAQCLQPELAEGPSFTYSDLQVRKPINDRGVGAWRAYAQHLKPLCQGLAEAGLV